MYELIMATGPGYLDSLAALVFFLLIGKLFQNKTYSALNFERNYKSYFPISVTTLTNGKETTIPVDKLESGRRIIVKNNELIPADSVLISEAANIDYSFVTGESSPVAKKNGDLIYAGGRQAGGAVEVETIKEVSQSYLTQLWNNKSFTKHYHSNLNSLVNVISKYFTLIVLLIAAISFVYWAPSNLDTAFNTFTAVLIIACPCALALSTPFTLGNAQRIFGRNKFCNCIR
jgi:Cu+-exporting ATPase